MIVFPSTMFKVGSGGQASLPLSSILVEFDRAVDIADVVVSKRPVRYDMKMFWFYSFDDGYDCFHTHILPLFHGGLIGGTEPVDGLAFNDGFGNEIKYKATICPGGHWHEDAPNQIGSAAIQEFDAAGWKFAPQPVLASWGYTLQQIIDYYENVHDEYAAIDVLLASYSMNQGFSNAEWDAINNWGINKYGYGVGGGATMDVFPYNAVIEEMTMDVSVVLPKFVRKTCQFGYQIDKEYIYNDIYGMSNIEAYLASTNEDNHFIRHLFAHNLLGDGEWNNWRTMMEFINTNYKDDLYIGTLDEIYKYIRTFHLLGLAKQTFDTNKILIDADDSNVLLCNGNEYDKAITVKISHPTALINRVKVNGGQIVKKKGTGTSEALIDVQW